MNDKQLNMIARGLRDARPMRTIDNQFMTTRDRDALLVWSQCCIHIASHIAQAHPRFNQNEFLETRCGVPALHRDEARSSADAPPVAHAWQMADGSIQQLTEAQAAALQSRKYVVTTDPPPYNSTPLRKL